MSIRQYHVPIHDQYKGYNHLWLRFSGGLRDRPLQQEEFFRILEKAKKGKYTHLLFPENSLEHESFANFLESALTHGFSVRLQLSASGLLFSMEKASFLLKRYPLGIDCILDTMPYDDTSFAMLGQHSPVRWVLPGLRSLPIWRELKQVPLTWLDQLYCYFPYLGENKYIFKPRQVQEQIKQLKKYLPSYCPRPLPGMEIFEPRLTTDSDVESLVEPVIYTKREVIPKISVVIPTYNNARHILSTLQHLQKQKVELSCFEVILVDDGSSDSTSELILKNYEQFSFPFTYIYYPRLHPRTMGDHRFRAGLARNLGVKWAQGAILAFLDADMIVPPDYIEDLLDLHKKYDVIQWRRDYLTESATLNFVSYEDLDKTKDCFIPEGGYWADFYDRAATHGWSELTDYWKYTCTYALSLPRDLFEKVGWFRKTYCFYGFEDTDLGLQLMRAGVKFYFYNKSVFHLFHKTERSEFRNSFFHRQKLLKNTAKIFYYNTLDPDAYRVFKYLLSPFF